MNFRKLLLNRCQKEFERDQDDDEIFEKKQKELDAAKEVSLLFHFGCTDDIVCVYFMYSPPHAYLCLPSGRGA